MGDPRELRARILGRLVDDEFAALGEADDALTLGESAPLGRVPDDRIGFHLESLYVALGDQSVEGLAGGCL